MTSCVLILAFGMVSYFQLHGSVRWGGRAVVFPAFKAYKQTLSALVRTRV